MKRELNALYAQINEHKSYLRQTDYKVIKESETSFEMTEELKDDRQHSRDEINRLEYEIGVLEDEIKEQQLEEDEM